MWLRRVIVLLAGAAVCGEALAQRSTPIQILHPTPAANDQFGSAVAIDGDTMVVGSSFDTVGGNGAQGSATVYRWTGTGWTFEATLTASDGATNDFFGNAVGIDGDTIIVGASEDDFGANTNQGSAYVFVRTGSAWTQQAKLLALDGAIADGFGYSVALSGDTAVVGVQTDDVGPNLNQGSAYVFVRSGTNWSQQAVLVAADGATNDNFGRAVALDGDTAVVGAYSDDVGANSNQGSAYVFVRSGTSWSQQAQLVAADGAANDNFGNAVAMVGETALIGASGDDVGANANQGSSYVFVRTGTVWNQQGQLTVSDGAANDTFGVSVALGRNGDTAAIGANAHDVGAATNQGIAYVFSRFGTTWSQTAQLAAPDGQSFDNFGVSVGLSGEFAVVGAYGDDVGANSNQGSAWVFSRLGETWIGPDLTLLASNGTAGDLFGISVALSGNTALVGAHFDDVGANVNQGSAYVFTRSGTTWTQQAQLTATDGSANDNFGNSVALSGDTAVVGAYSDDVGVNSNQGSAYVFVRAGTTWTQQARLNADDGVAGDVFGGSIAVSGDTAIVGALQDMVGANVGQGSAYVFVRSGTTWTQQAHLTADDGMAGDQFGVSVAVSGDTAIVGAYGDDVGATPNQGSAYVFTRSSSIWVQQAQLTVAGGGANDSFGSSVAISGDTAIVGVSGDNVGPNVDQGSAFVFTRLGTAWTQQAWLIATGGAAGDLFGISVALSGDKAIVGAMGANSSRGTAYGFSRSSTTWTQQTQLAAADGAAGDLLGVSVALSGDSVILGAWGDDVGVSADQGSMGVFDVAANDFSTVRNESTGTNYPSLSAAFAAAQSGQQISATSAAFRSSGVLDTFGRSIALISSGSIRTPSTTSITLTNTSSLAAPAGSPIEIFGQLRAGAGSYPDIYADRFLLGSRGGLTVRAGASMSFNVFESFLCGVTRTEADTYLTFTGDVHNSGLLTLSGGTTWTTWGKVASTGSIVVPAGCSIVAGGQFTTSDTFTATAGMISTPSFDNRGTANFLGTSALFGSFINQAGAVTTIRSGTLYVFGSLTNGGTIVGTLCSSCLTTPPNLDVGGDLSIGSDANLNMPFIGSLVHIGGAFDCAINSNASFDLSLATLQLEGSGLERTLEVMSRDIGPSAEGLDRTMAGHYPIGVLEIGPTPSTVRLVDAHDNDGLGQASCEALYLDTLRIDAGSRLINTTCKVYYNTLINNGVVDMPSNLIAITPPCAADFDGVGGVTVADLFAYLDAWFAQNGVCTSNCTADFDDDNDVDVVDLFDFLDAWFAQNGVCG